MSSCGGPNADPLRGTGPRTGCAGLWWAGQVSLTSHLNSKDSYLRGFLLDNFPATRPAAEMINRQLQDSSSTFVERVDGSDVGLVGTAVGYVLQAVWDPHGLSRDTAASCGARLLDRRYHPRRFPVATRAPELYEMAVEQLVAPPLDELSSHGRLQAALMLARLEQAYRVGAGSRQGVEIARDLFRAGSGSLSDRVNVFASPATVRDLDRVASAAISDLAWLHGCNDVRFGPEFTQSAALRGADADIIADGQLLELKAGASARGVAARLSLWQTLGYVLADSDDAYRIETVSLVALRRRTRFGCPVQDYLELLAGQATGPVDVWRGRFAAMLAAGGSVPGRVP